MSNAHGMWLSAQYAKRKGDLAKYKRTMKLLNEWVKEHSGPDDEEFWDETDERQDETNKRLNILESRLKALETQLASERQRNQGSTQVPQGKGKFNRKSPRIGG